MRSPSSSFSNGKIKHSTLSTTTSKIPSKRMLRWFGLVLLMALFVMLCVGYRYAHLHVTIGKEAASLSHRVLLNKAEAVRNSSLISSLLSLVEDKGTNPLSGLLARSQLLTGTMNKNDSSKQEPASQGSDSASQDGPPRLEDVSIMIRTWHKDAVYLPWVLKSVEKFFPRHKEVVIVSESRDMEIIKRIVLPYASLASMPEEILPNEGPQPPRVNDPEEQESKVYVAAPADPSKIPLLEKLPLRINIKFVEEETYMDGSIQQKYSKLNGDRYCSGKYIFHLDSDVVFNSPVTEELVFYNGLPIIEYCTYYHLQHIKAVFVWSGGEPHVSYVKTDQIVPLTSPGAVWVWKSGTERALGREVDFEFSRNNMHVYPAAAYERARKHIEKVHKMSFLDFLKRQKGVRSSAFDVLFSDFNYMGAYLYYFENNTMHWVDTEGDEQLRGEFVTQFNARIQPFKRIVAEMKLVLGEPVPEAEAAQPRTQYFLQPQQKLEELKRRKNRLVQQPAIEEIRERRNRWHASFAKMKSGL